MNKSQIRSLVLVMGRKIRTNAITLHYISYLEWLEYKTAKPLLYTVYRTRNRRQLGRK